MVANYDPRKKRMTYEHFDEPEPERILTARDIEERKTRLTHLVEPYRSLAAKG